MTGRSRTASRRPGARRLRTAAIGLVAALLTVAAGAPAAAGTLPLAAAGPEGFYLEVARGVAAELPEVEPVETAGSAENLRLLEKGRVRFALAQQDVVSEHLRKHDEAGRPSRVRVVGRVFYDYLHIFVRSPIHVDRAGEFQRYRIWPGAAESGTRKTAVRFLESVGVPLSSLYRPAVTLEDLAACGGDRNPGPPAAPMSEAEVLGPLVECFRAEAVDVAMLMAMAGSDPACRILASGRVTLHSLDYQTLRLLTSESEASPFERQITLTNIPADTYPNQTRSVPTVAVSVLLVAGDGEYSKTARRVLGAARRTWSSLAGTPGEAGCRRLEELPDGGSLGEANLEMLGEFEEREDLSNLVLPWAVAALLALALAAGALWLWRRGLLRQAWRLLRGEAVAARILAGLVAGVVVITLLTYLIEHRTNEHFSTPWESAWSITIYLFSGLEDRNPYTTGGRVVATFGLILGPVFFAFLTGWLAGVFIRWEKRMPQNLRDHVLLVNWNPRALQIVRELHHEVLSERDGAVVIVVLTDDDGLDVKKLKEAGVGREETFEDFYVTVGDPTTERALLNANAQDARSIVLLADDARPERADERSIRSLIMLRRIARRHEPDDLHVVVELADAANVAVLEEMADGFPGLLEWVSGIQARTCLLAQAAMHKGVTGFYGDLLRVTGDTNEVYTVPVADSAVGSMFREYAARVLGNGGVGDLVPVGVQRRYEGHWKIFTNPRPGSPGARLEAGDRLVVLAYEPPSAEDLPG